MMLTTAAQAWHDCLHESRESLMSAAIERARLEKRSKGRGINRKVYLERGDGTMIAKLRALDQPAVRETRGGRWSTTNRCAHMLIAGEVQSVIAALPARLQRLGNYLYSPLATDVGVLEPQVHAALWFSIDTAGLSQGRRLDGYWITLAGLRSYRASRYGAPAWGPGRIAGEVARYGVSVSLPHWSRDWSGLWRQVLHLLEQCDGEALGPIDDLICDLQERGRQRRPA